MRVTSEMQVPSLFLRVKKYMFGGKMQGVEVSQVCRWAVTGGVAHWVCTPWEYAGQNKLGSSAATLTPGKSAPRVLSSATGFVY